MQLRWRGHEEARAAVRVRQDGAAGAEPHEQEADHRQPRVPVPDYLYQSVNFGQLALDCIKMKFR